jgi:predicted transcriptional regulator
VNNFKDCGYIILNKRIYLVVMDKRYATLQTLANIVCDTAHPSQYFCTPREMILHSVFDWELIHTHLSLLVTEELISMRQADTLQFSITEKGLQKITAMADAPEEKLKLQIRHESLTG